MKSVCLLLVIVGTLSGCNGGAGDAPPRRVVEGEVSFNGVPLEHGNIRFVPQPDGPVLTATIEKGRYRADNKGGAPLGSVKVEIVSAISSAEMSEDQILTGSPAAKSVVIPAKFNTSSTLSETIVKGNDPQVLNFKLSEK